MKITSSINRALLGIILFSALIRFFNINIPFVERFNNISRQSMCASVARNYWKDGFNLFRPGLDQGGAGFNLYNVELPINTYIMSLGYLLTSGPHEGVARSVSVIFSLILILYAYLLIRRISDSSTAFWSAVILSISPMSVALSRSIQPDIAMSAMMVAGFYYFHRYVYDKRQSQWMAAAAFLLIAVLIRPFALFVFLPMAAACLRHDGKRAFTHLPYYAVLVVSLAGLSWYVYMWHIGNTQDVYYSPYRGDRGELSKGANYLSLFDFESLKLNFKVMIFHVLTPLGVLFCLAGILKGIRFKDHLIMWFWILGAVIYLLIMWPTAVYHPYYLFPFFVPLTYFVALGVKGFISSKAGNRIIQSKWPVILMLFFQVLSVGYYYRLLYLIPEDRQRIVQTGQEADRLIPKEDLIMASWGGSPIQLYYCDRKGWPINPELKDTQKIISKFEKLRKEGAKWYVTSRNSEIQINAEFLAYLRERYPVVSDIDSGWVFDLT